MQSQGNSMIESSYMPLNTWYHLATVLSGTSGRIYVNAYQTIQDTMTLPAYAVKTNCRIGDTAAINVVIDEVKWYNRALSAAEVTNKHHAN
jgi:hypothetical protein